MPLPPGTRLGPYEVLSQIGAGGMGEVYKARDTRLNRDVAIKVLPEHLALNADLRERFQREAETIANLKHPNICVLHDIGEKDGTQYLVMEYLEGETLAERLSQSRDRKGAGLQRTDAARDPLASGRPHPGRAGEGDARGTDANPMPLDQVLRYAIEISDALDKAHRKGATHRDIKPGNIMLTKVGGTIGTKLLDFGLAKLKQQAIQPTPLGPNDSTPPLGSPLLQSKGAGKPTIEGTILGTVQYMSPEQVEGRIDDIDGRSDIFSFGATVYEMLTGRKAFEGKSQASVMAKILEVDPPPVSSVQSQGTAPEKISPPALDRVVKRCLEKDRDDRWQSALDLNEALKWIRDGSVPAAPPSTAVVAAPKSGWKRKLAFSAVGLAAWAITAAIVWNLRAPAPQPVSRLTISLPPGQHLAALDQPAIAISPDGKNIVYVASQSRPLPLRGGEAPAREGAGQPGQGFSVSPLPDGRGSDVQMLYLRPLDSNESKPIAGTEGAANPFFSPDGQWIGFFAGARLKKISVNGGSAVTLAIAPTQGGAGWSSQGTLAFQPSNSGAQGLEQVSNEGGTPQSITRLEIGEFVQRWPEFLPGGKAVLFAGASSNAAWNSAQIAVQQVGTDGRKTLLPGTQPRYAGSGHLLFAQAGTLMAAPFDTQHLTLLGAAVPAFEGVMESTYTGAAQYGVSSTGTLIYLSGGVAGNQTRLVWVSRNGEEQPMLAAPRTYQFPRVSPDGHQIAVAVVEQEQAIWVYNISRDTLTRLTFEGKTNSTPAWSPDGSRIVFNSDRAGQRNLFWQAADGSGGVERLTTSDYLNSPNSFSPDGQLLAFGETTPETGRDIWVLNLKDRKAAPFLKTPFDDGAAKFSPDGKWLAYSSDESGRREIYVQPYPGLGGKWQISSDGGQEPVWNPKDGELFYRSGSKMMAVDVDMKSGFSAGKPHMLFEGPYLLTATSFPYYDVSPDGQRFLMLKPVESQASAPTQINVVLNWFEELKQKVPVK